MNQVILLEDGWNRLKSGGVMKIEQILEEVQGGDYKSGITTEEYSTLYTTVYTMCTQKPPNNWSEVTQASLRTIDPETLCLDKSASAHTVAPPRSTALVQQLLRRGQGLSVGAHTAAHQREARRGDAARTRTPLGEPQADDQVPLARFQVPRPLLRQATLVA